VADPPAAARAGRWAGSLIGRIARAWRLLPPERRLAAGAAAGLFVTLFLPWYQETAFESQSGKVQQVSGSATGWGAFSFVEAAVLLVAVGVIVLLVQRAEGRAFHLPGGDGFVIMAAGFWTCVLIIWRIFDKQGGTAHGQIPVATGIEWGIFIALADAALLAYAGSRIRAAHQPEPPLPGEQPAGVPSRPDRPVAADPTLRYDERPPPARRPQREPGRSEDQLTIPLEHEE